MTLTEVIQYAVGAFLALSTVIEISPLKLNPWKLLGKAVGKAINGDVVERLDKIERQQAEAEHRAEQNEALLHRHRILRFGDECKNSVKHSEEMFNQVMDDITEYEKYCREHPNFPNGKTVVTIEIIKQAYKNCLKENDFL